MKYILLALAFASIGQGVSASPLTVKDLSKLIIPEEGVEDDGIELIHGGNRSEYAPVWRPFVKLLRACDSSCSPVNYNAWRFDGGRSCHNVGRALDVFGFRCGRQIYWAQTKRFRKIVSCFRKAGMKVLHNQADHYDHGHFSIKCQGGTYW